MTSNSQDVGPLAEEAARFAEALSDWARGHVGMPSGSIGHGAECTLCPFCQLLSLLRHAKPDTFSHLLDASASLTAALRSVVDTHGSNNSHSGFERIDLDDDADVE